MDSNVIVEGQAKGQEKVSEVLNLDREEIFRRVFFPTFAKGIKDIMV